MKRIHWGKRVFFFLGCVLLLVSCSQEEVEEAIDQMLLPENYTTNQGVDVPPEATLFINGEKAPLAMFERFPSEIIESVTVVRSSAEYPGGEIRVQLKESFTTQTMTRLGTAGIETARLGAGKISEMIVQMATLNADITDYAYYADNEKVSMADLANHHISELASFQVNPQQRRIDLSWRKGDTPSPVRIGKGLFYPMSSVSVRKVLESRFDKKTLSEYALYKDGKPITPEQLDDLPITELENISPNDTSRTIEIQSKQPEHGSIQP